MAYKIREISEMTGLPASTLRYYEKEQLLPSVQRDRSGIRLYTEKDLEWLAVISCLKDTDMPIMEIRKFVSLCMEGDSTLEERRQMVLRHKEVVEAHIQQMQKNLEHINFKVEYYNTACLLGSEKPLKEIKYEDDNKECVAELKKASNI